MIVIGYFTDEKYGRLARRMGRSAEEVGLTCQLYSFEDLGSWQLNVNQKPKAILRALQEYPDQDVLYVDADAVFRQYPKELEAVDKDLAVWFHGPWSVSGTVFVKNRPGGREIVEAWIKECDAHPDQHDDAVNLYEVLKRLGRTRAHRLPPSYYWMADSMRARFPTAVPVIEHFNVGEHTFPDPRQ